MARLKDSTDYERVCDEITFYEALRPILSVHGYRLCNTSLRLPPIEMLDDGQQGGVSIRVKWHELKEPFFKQEGDVENDKVTETGLCLSFSEFQPCVTCGGKMGLIWIERILLRVMTPPQLDVAQPTGQ